MTKVEYQKENYLCKNGKINAGDHVRTIILKNAPHVAGFSSTAGKMEGEGPLAALFDEVELDPYFGKESWEKAESELMRRTLARALTKARMGEENLDLIFAGDLQQQCAASTFALRGQSASLFGVYGACSTMAESLALAAMSVNAGYAEAAAAVTSSHFSTAEREFRTPMEYGGQRTPTSQWTVTGSGAVILSRDTGSVRVCAVTPGKIVDAGITDANDMGSAMAPAALDTIMAHLAQTHTAPGDYDLILTGDLGHFGSEILCELALREGCDISDVHNDCGKLVFDREVQDVHSGGSGCGCSASVLCAKILPEMQRGEMKRVLFCATGALLSPVTTMQGESIPSIACAVELTR